MDSSTQFNGLAMPVFTAFGWAGEETALKYALSQLELFIESLHQQLSSESKARFPHFGFSAEGQSVYLAANENVESDTHISFFARPMSLEMQLVFANKKVLAKGLKQAVADPARWHRLVTELGPDWSLRLQQLERNEETKDLAHYQDLFKDTVAQFDEDTAAEVMSKAAYLNGEDTWGISFFLSFRFSSEQCAAMGLSILDVMTEKIQTLIPLLTFFTGRVTKKSGKGKKRKGTAVAAKTEASEEPTVDDDEQFTYVADLKPLHLRRGFVNLLPKHWPFFAINSRTTTRPVTVYYEGVYDKNSAVWRLVANDQARLVLSPIVHQWLEENFDTNDRVKVVARKLDEKEIQISLRPVD
ncbi:MAG: hypothetical protein ACE5FD_03395 [Anaerolineae bacterium]